MFFSSVTSTVSYGRGSSPPKNRKAIYISALSLAPAKICKGAEICSCTERTRDTATGPPARYHLGQRHLLRIPSAWRLLPSVCTPASSQEPAGGSRQAPETQRQGPEGGPSCSSRAASPPSAAAVQMRAVERGRNELPADGPAWQT